MKNLIFKIVTTIVLLSLTPNLTFASNDSYSSYDDIVKDLESSSRYISTSEDDAGDGIIRIHGAVGLVTSRLSLDGPKGMPNSISMSGVEAQIGIDLFSPEWIAMGAIRSFQEESVSNGSAQLREFDLIVSYRSALARNTYLNIGGGMAARYLEFSGNLPKGLMTSNSTPASLFTAGIDAAITKPLSIGAFLSYRSVMVHDTADDGAFDGSLRLTGHF